MKLTVHTLVKNEDQWIWFALQSVLPFAEKIFIYDTGSTDKTCEVIKVINSPKIIFEERGPQDRENLIKLRNEQIIKTETEWFLILDGDEIWPEDQLNKLLKEAEKAPGNIVAFINRTRNCLGDVYHYLPEEAGGYSFAGRKGNLTLRLMRKTKDLKITGKYPLESYANNSGPLNSQDKNLLYVDCWYLHTTYLKRSSKDSNKVSGSLGKAKIWERGIQIKTQDLPEVFKLPRPKVVDNPYKSRGLAYELAALAMFPILKIKRGGNEKY